jgi:transposase
MTKYREILRLHSQGISQRSIARSCQCSRDRVSQVISKAAASEICWPLDPKIADTDLEQSLFPKNVSRKSSRRYPDYAYIDKEMMRNGVTLKLLWKEFCEECHQVQALPLMYSQFCFHYREFVEKKRATMHIPRKPGEQTEVDWAGNPARVIDRDTGEFIPAYIFVGVLPFSMYAYAEAFPSTDMESWITAHNHMYQFFGGATRMLIPDNLKTGVDRSSWYTPQINRTYHELAEHFNTAVIPARVRKPKDKPSVEGTVGNLST